MSSRRGSRVYNCVVVVICIALFIRLSVIFCWTPYCKSVLQSTLSNDHSSNMSSLRVVSSKLAAQIDQELMGPKIGFTLQQLMELAGLSVAEAVQREFPPAATRKGVLIVAGPGNNGGDGLVCARHLKLFGYDPVVYYPKRSSRTEFYGQLVKQLDFFNVPVLSETENWTQYLNPDRTLCVVDAIFGFSFKPPMREPFAEIIKRLHAVQESVPIVAVDIPTGWDVDAGPVEKPHLTPKVFVSLTAPKPCTNHIDPAKTVHYVGGRFIPQEFAQQHGFEQFDYKGVNQILKL
ncbi:NADHX epimerase KNAG_0F01100 [Huiozyma naganishii CBS 8797]|uniref:NAD(P)H-hydrate epimerase n=1 Tax=Huiozyma naganishii (strain ATCC MYA-139 / BCRC 22969 / CBS 8797 / KCTC 17520 / NBRC 10181 / NCYC 3082 / Yp74L-3) TaxID=1071383 RepID=J7RMI9_HUIN7|nr:hypothetical protein KNAG_0F01100 [Kazachstania naganishii CBS 8797]CCK70778.1 hypothetical protein KNAG_0F01100 [Kazachstania naganishii CBS 8797]